MRYITFVPIEVYTSTKPSNPRRAVAASAGLLALATALAWGMTQNRPRETATHRIRPAGWAISLQCPPQFQHYRVLPSAAGTVYRFYALGEDDAPMLMEFHRVNTAQLQAPWALYSHVVRMHLELTEPPLLMLPCESHDKKLGPLEAVELWDPLLPNLLLRVATAPAGEAYAVVLLAKNRVEPPLYDTFQNVCDSVRYEGK